MKGCNTFPGRWYLGIDDREKTGHSAPSEREIGLSRPKEEIYILGIIEQMCLGRNVNIKIEVGGKRAIYCFGEIFKGDFLKKYRTV